MDEHINLGNFFELTYSNQMYVEGLTLHEARSDFFQDYTCDLEVNGSIVTGPVELRANTRFRIMVDFESYINAIGIDYDSEDVTFIAYVYK